MRYQMRVWGTITQRRSGRENAEESNEPGTSYSLEYANPCQQTRLHFSLRLI